MFAVRVIPEGPLHPDDAALALVAGVLVGALLRRSSSVGPGLVVAASVLLAWRQPQVVPEGLVERPLPGVVFVAAAAWTVLAVRVVRLGASMPPASTTLAAAIAGCAAVWATAPDTEAALISGAVLFAAAPWVRSSSGPSLTVVSVLPSAAAVAGTVGRPERLPFVLAVALSAVVVVRLGGLLLVWGMVRRQRAGTPTTVAPGATSVVTTAPAPTTAP